MVTLGRQARPASGGPGTVTHVFDPIHPAAARSAARRMACEPPRTGLLRRPRLVGDLCVRSQWRTRKSS